MEELRLREYRPLSLRIWHWLNAFVITGLLLTVLIRKTLLSWRTNSSVILSKLEAAGHSISPELSVDIAKTIRNPLWDWHIWLGYILGALFLFRLFIAIFIEKRGLVLPALKSIFNKKIVQKNTRHYYLVKSFYALFHVMTVLMFVTGILLIFKNNLGTLILSMSGSLKEIHELSMWFFVGFIGIHLVGIIISEHGEDTGIVSDMICGGKKDNNSGNGKGK